MKKRKSSSDAADKVRVTPDVPPGDSIEDAAADLDAAPAVEARGEEVTVAGQDVATVAEEVTEVGQDVSMMGTEVTSEEDAETAWDEEAITAVAGAPTLGEGAAGSSEFAAAWDDAQSSGDGEASPADERLSSDADPSASAASEAEDAEALPNDDSRFESILESLLFASDRPLTVADLKRLLGERDSKRLSAALEALKERRAESGVQLISVAGGWQLRTHPANGAWVAKLVSGRPQRLSRAMMETLAIVAYRQPITRPEIDEIRGVDCGPVLRTLLDRTLIRVIGKKEEVGRPILYGTTPEFLKTFSLRDLTELPTLREFHELGAEEQARVDATAPGGDGAPPASLTDAPPLRPSTADLPEVDTAEEDALLDELEQATQLASRATKAPIDPDAEGAEDATAPDSGEP